jgi:hypothetical protein
MSFDADIRQFLTPGAFATYLAGLSPFSWRAVGSTIHNTYIPNEAQWHGKTTMLAMQADYVGRGWTAGPHLYLASGAPNPQDDGIWQMTPPAHQGIHAGPCNDSRYGIEVVGDFQAKPWSSAQRTLLLDTLDVLHTWAGLAADINGHRDCMLGRTCPGNAAYAALPALKSDLAARLARPSNILWNERWGPIATPDQTSWQWAIPQAWENHWQQLGKCISSALYDNMNGVVVQAFMGGDVRARGDVTEVTYKL